MARSSGPGQGAGPANSEAAFLERLAGVLGEWQRRIGSAGATPAEVALVAREASELRQQAQSSGFGAVEQLLYLENIIHQTPHALPQAVQALAAGLRAAGVRGGQVLSGTVRLDSSMIPPRPPGPAALTGVVSPPSMLMPQPSVSSRPPPAQPPGDGRGKDPTMVSMQAPPVRGGVGQPSMIAASPPPQAAPPGIVRPPREAAPPAPLAQPVAKPSPLPRAPQPSAPPPPREDPAGDGGRLPDSVVAPRQPPSLLQKTFLGLRAFRNAKKGADLDLPLAGAPGAPPAQEGMFGFRGLSSEAPRQGSSPGRTSRPSRSSRPGVRESSGSGPRPSGLDRDSWRASRPRKIAQEREPAVPRWFYIVIGAVGLLGVATTAAIIIYGRRTKDAKAPVLVASAPAQAHSPSGPAAGATATSEPSGGGGSAAVVEPVTRAIHERGAETPELHALLEMQSKLASACRDDPTTCGRGWTPLSKEALTPVDLKDFTPSAAPQGPLPAWLRRLKLPSDMPVSDEPALRSSFEFDTKNIAGRQGVQAKLFNCAAYADIFESTLIKYGAPAWLTAVVYQESACHPGATSDVGAKGLWQFMPESARMYGLRVVEGDVDERLNPIKSTDAAVHFLTDMQRKLGSWDLTLAAYNAGPFAIIARLSQIGQNAGFWDLVHAHLLPEETAGYVPAIEAYALVLENLSRLQFSRDGKRLESTAEILVKPGTRLSLLARASSTTTLHVRELNPEFLRDVVPDGETTARVPDAESHRAETFLGSWSPDDSRDTCVPEDFDWGAKEFETSKYAKACAQTRTPQ